MPGLLGKKTEMTSVFSAEDVDVPCIVIEVGPCVVTQVKTADRDNYEAIQLGFQDAKDKHTTRPLQGHFKTVGVINKRHLVEFMGFGSDYKFSDKITAGLFNDTCYVDVRGASRGKGFQGVVKRHGFGGVGQSTHGQGGRLCAPGAVGTCSYPAKVFKGMRMAGQMGSRRTAVQDLEVVKVTPEHNILVSKGSAPRAKGSVIAMEK